MLLAICYRSLACLILLTTLARGYKPVFVMHGIFDSPASMQIIKKTILHHQPDTNVTIIDMFNNFDSTVSMWKQTEAIRKKYGADFKNPSGVHLIGYSQGGILLRGLIQTTNDHNIHTLSCLSSPLMGEFGIPLIAQKYVPGLTLEIATEVFYTPEWQEFSVANYWNDPTQHDKFLKDSRYLALLNYPNSTKDRDNFIKLKHISLVGGPNDDVILPWGSSHFGFYDADLNVHPMEELDVYQEDTFGLKTLNKLGKINKFTYKNIFHTSWPKSVKIIEESIIPYLD